MNKKIFFFLLALSAAFASCKEDETMRPKVTLSAEAVTLLVGGEATLSVASGASDVRWTSSNKLVAAVDNSGKVTALSLGEATVNAVTPDGRSGFCRVAVVSYVTAITLPAHDTMIIHEKHKLAPEVAPEEATDQTLTWSSSNEAIATVDSTGEVTGVGLGEVVITASSSFTAAEAITASCTLLVKAQPMDSVTLNIDTVRTLIMGRTYLLAATLYPANATDKRLTWTSDATGVATVDSMGLVTPVAPGTASITVTTTEGGRTAKAVVKVRDGYPTLKLGTVEWAAANVYWKEGGTSQDNFPTERPDMLSTLYQYNAQTSAWYNDWNSSENVAGRPSVGNVCATAFGAGWRYPSSPELRALGSINLTDTTSTWAAAGSARGNAVAGRFFGPKHKTCSFDNLEGCIFLPALGYKDETAGALQEQDVKGYYWSGSAYDFNATDVYVMSLDATAGKPQLSTKNRIGAYAIRCVHTVTP